MKCKSCSSENQGKFVSEINVHFTGLENLDKPSVFVFPRLLVCMDCGFAEFAMTANELQLLEHGAATRANATSHARGLGFELAEVAAGLTFVSGGEIKARERAADKPLAVENGFHSH